MYEVLKCMCVCVGGGAHSSVVVVLDSQPTFWLKVPVYHPEGSARRTWLLSGSLPFAILCVCVCVNSCWTLIMWYRNLLCPSGVHLESGTLTVRIFRGEDLPQMDPGYFEGLKKLLGTVQQPEVNSYCTVSFAGHKGKTPVIWNEQYPEWNMQINLGVRVSESHQWINTEGRGETSTVESPNLSPSALRFTTFQMNKYYHRVQV